MSPKIVARHLNIRGVVQGVGFRASMVAEAERLGVVGWVCNRADGSVEAVVQGPIDAVAAIVDWARQGPPRSQVVAVEVTEIGVQPFPTFERRPSV